MSYASKNSKLTIIGQRHALVKITSLTYTYLIFKINQFPHALYSHKPHSVQIYLKKDHELRIALYGGG